MIAPQHQMKALKAVHEYTLRARRLALSQPGEKSELFAILGAIEHLLGIMMEEKDSTGFFQDILKLLLDECPCPGAMVALKSFDGGKKK